MITVEQVLAFGLASLLIIMIPGPSVLFVVGRALSYGRRTALVSAVGNDLGTFVLAVGVALGIGSIVERSVLIFTVMKMAGAAYLIFLGVRAFLRRRENTALEGEMTSRGGWRAGIDGFLVGVANPKTVVFLTAVLPQFVDPSRGHVPAQMFGLAMIFAVLAVITDVMWSLAAGAARTWFGRSPQRMQMVGGAGGLAMIGLGIGVAFTGRKD